MRDLSKFFGWFFYAVVIGLLVWTARLDYRLIARLIPEQPTLPFFGLVLFDGGLTGWLFTYIYRSRSSLQRLISAIMTIVSLAGIGIFTAISLIFEAEQVITFVDTENLPNLVVIALGVQTFLFVAATVLFHLADPEIMEKNAIQAIQTDIVSEALEQFEQKAPEVAKDLTEALSEMMLGNLVNSLSFKIGEDGKWEYEIVRHEKGYAEKQEERKKARRERRKAKREAEKETDPVAKDDSKKKSDGGRSW